jgi:hypothetical protein
MNRGRYDLAAPRRPSNSAALSKFHCSRYAATMSEEFLVLRFYPLSDTEEAQIKLQKAADDGFELVDVIPSADSAMVIMKRRKRTAKSAETNPYRPRGE